MTIDMKKTIVLLRECLSLLLKLEKYFGYDNSEEGREIGKLIDKIENNENNI